MNRVILFDFDGVLADTLDNMLQFSRQACAQLGHPIIPSADDLNALESMDILSYGRQLGLPVDKVEDFGEMMVDYFRRDQLPPPLFVGFTDVLSQLSDSSLIGIVTGNSGDAVRGFIKHHGISDYFSCVIASDGPAGREDKITQAMAALGGHTDSTYMVGDSVSDIRAANRVGVTSIAVAWGHQSEARLAGEGPSFIVHSPAEILQVLSGHLEG